MRTRRLIFFLVRYEVATNFPSRVVPLVSSHFGFTKLTVFFPSLLRFNGFYWVLPSFTGFYWVLLGFTGFYWVLLGFTGFYVRVDEMVVFVPFRDMAVLSLKGLFPKSILTR